MNSSLPFFKSHYSIGRSILTLEKPEDRKEDGPDSIIDIAVKNNLEEVFLVDDSMSGLLEGYTNLLDEKIKLVFGLRLEMCPDITEKDEDSILNSSKIVLTDSGAFWAPSITAMMKSTAFILNSLRKYNNSA